MWDTSESKWAQALAARRLSALPLHDLTNANPTECGLTYDPHLLDTLLNSAGMHYAADPLGSLEAREAVCAYYLDHQQAIGAHAQLHLDSRQVLLTASTSEAYSFLFRLLCDPGDEVLIAQPSYPLFDFLADLDDVRLVSYPVFYDHGWHLDAHALSERITDRTRAIVIVHPNNPTGHFTRPQDREQLQTLAAAHQLALVVDEVFLDYAFDAPAASFALGEHPVLTFVLSGLSKVAGLPQMKLSWIAAFGTAAMLEPALARLEVIADTFLSVSTPMQYAMSKWLAGRKSIQQQIRERVAANRACLDRALCSSSNVNRLAVEGGWYAVLRVPSLHTGEEIAVQLLNASGVALHPGSFFGMNASGLLVISLLPTAASFKAAIEALLEWMDTIG